MARATVNGATTTYVYNALGQRVERSGSGVPYGGTLDEYYDAFGSKALIVNTSTSIIGYVPSVGGRDYVKYQAGSTFFMHANPLGSTGLITSAGNSIVQDELFYPFGQQWVPWLNWGSLYSEQFASLNERDAESGLDPTPNRMFTSLYGRWLSPDPLAGDITNPQSLNRYAYVMNNPTGLIDPLGLSASPQGCKPGTANCKAKPTCYGMVCADQYYGGSLFEGFGGNMMENICVLYGVAGFCSQNGLIINGNDEFDAIAGAPGTYFTPGGQLEINSSGRSSTGTGSFGFDEGLWMRTWLGFISEAWQAGQSGVPTTGYVSYRFWNGAQSAASQSPGENYSTTGFIQTLNATVSNTMITNYLKGINEMVGVGIAQGTDELNLLIYTASGTIPGTTVPITLPVGVWSFPP